MADASRGGEKKKKFGAATTVLLPDPNRTFAGQDPAVLLAMCLFGEARGESERARRAVAQVVLNRARHPHRVFGSRADRSAAENLRLVILQPRQFSCFHPGDPNCAKLLRPLDYEPAAVWQRCLDAAQQALDDGDQPDTLTLNSDHYFDDSLQPPSWADPAKQTVLIGRLRFYRLYLPLPTAGAGFLLRIGADDGSIPTPVAAGDAAATPSRRASSPPETSCRAGVALLGASRGEPSRRHRREGSGSGSHTGHPALHHPSQRTPRLGPNRWFQWSRGLSSLCSGLASRDSRLGTDQSRECETILAWIVSERLPKRLWQGQRANDLRTLGGRFLTVAARMARFGTLLRVASRESRIPELAPTK